MSGRRHRVVCGVCAVRSQRLIGVKQVGLQVIIVSLSLTLVLIRVLEPARLTLVLIKQRIVDLDLGLLQLLLLKPLLLKPLLLQVLQLAARDRGRAWEWVSGGLYLRW